MYNITVKDILEATGGALLSGNEAVELSGISINSNTIKPGELFVPLIGARTDAHRYIESAMEIGAATLTSQHVNVVVSEKPYIFVSDTLKALQDIGRYIRSRFSYPVIGVTGSVGKTTTREMIAAVLSRCINVGQTAGNLNSQIGVPLSISAIEEGVDTAVLEMGISEPGQMEILSSIVRPDICVVTVIGVAHIKFLKTRENICREKLDIKSHMNPDGVLFINGDDELLAASKFETGVKTYTYGVGETCDYRAEKLHMENYRFVYDYVHGDTRVHVKLGVPGRHNVGNSIVAMAIAEYMGLDLAAAAEGLENFEGLRQKIINVPGKYTIIDDTYNASPDSVKASIDLLDDLECSGKKLIVLGDMLELDEDSDKYHYEVGEYLAHKNIDELIVVGELSANIVKAVEASDSKIRCYSLKDNGEVTLYLMSAMSPDDIVLIKGSNSLNLIEIVNNMRM